jgi:hypothetical protein
MKFEFELCDNRKIAAAASNCPLRAGRRSIIAFHILPTVCIPVAVGELRAV